MGDTILSNHYMDLTILLKDRKNIYLKGIELSDELKFLCRILNK